MTTWPALRTDKGLAREAGLAPHWMGTCGVLLGLPLIGALVVVPTGLALSRAFPEQTLGPVLLETGALLALSPVLSWVGLLFGMPLAILAGFAGFGGWAVSTLGGAICGFGAFLLIGGEAPTGTAMVFASAGAGLGAVYWLSGRLLVPKAFGAKPFRARKKNKA